MPTVKLYKFNQFTERNWHLLIWKHWANHITVCTFVMNLLRRTKKSKELVTEAKRHFSACIQTSSHLGECVQFEWCLAAWIENEQKIHYRRIHSGDQNDLWNTYVFYFENAGESRRPFYKQKSPLTYSYPVVDLQRHSIESQNFAAKPTVR